MKKVDRKKMIIEQMEIFKLLDNHSQRLLSQAAHVREFKKGECINNGIDLAKSVIIVLEGKLSCDRFHANGEAYSLFFLKEEEHYPFIDRNLAEFLDSHLIGKTRGKVIILSIKILDQLRLSNPLIDQLLLSKTNWHFNFAISLRCVYSATNASERAKRIIYLFNREFGVKQPDGSFYFPKWIKHYEIANSAATTREKVSQTISQLRQQGLVENRGHLLILKPAFLEQLKAVVNLEPQRIA
jgi:CRP-like cAMP-binding protein